MIFCNLDDYRGIGAGCILHGGDPSSQAKGFRSTPLPEERGAEWAENPWLAKMVETE